MRCAAGAGTLAFYGLLLATASNDVIAKLAQVPVGALTWAGPHGPAGGTPVAAAATYVVVRALRDSDAEDVMHLSFGQVVAATRATLLRRRPGRAARARRQRQAPATIAGGSEDR